MPSLVVLLGVIDPIDFLLDRYWSPGGWVNKIEQPSLVCPCAGSGWLGREWLEQRAPRCSCDQQTDNFDTVLHRVDCDVVPCPFHEETDEA